MTFATGTAYDFDDVYRRPARRSSSQGFLGVILLAGAVSAGAWVLAARPFAEGDATMRIAPAPGPMVRNAQARNTTSPPRPPIEMDFSVRIDSASLSPTYTASLMAASIARNTPFDLRAGTAQSAGGSAAPLVAPEQVASRVAPAVVVEAAVQDVPVPTPRPRDLDGKPVPTPPEVAAAGRVSRGSRTLASAGGSAAAPADGRNLFEKLFGISSQPAGPMLAYAGPEPASLPRASAPRMVPGPVAVTDGQTAVYDISAHTVYMPDGSTLEAHSGLGNLLDDPDHVHVRDRGATPPHLYDLTAREQLFHGVKALRLTPTGGGGVFGRAGLLAHTFMLGPNGQSNGCVSFRNYNAFLQAFENGSIKRLSVVARRS